MSFLESVYTGSFIMAIVFSALVGLYVCVRIFSYAMGKLESAKSASKTTQP